MKNVINSGVTVRFLFAVIFSITLLSAGTVFAQPKKWYVSATGNDANNGMSPATAWQHMQYANNNAAVINGDTISVLAGSYTERVTITKSLKFYGPNYNISPNGGTRNAEAIVSMNPIIFEAYTPGTTVEVKGFKLMNGAPITDANHQRTTTQEIDVLFEKNWVNHCSNLFAGSLSVWKTVTVVDNFFDAIDLTATSSAIQINDNAVVTITDNRIIGTAFAGILLDALGFATVSRNIIRNTPNEAAIQLAGPIGTAVVSENDIQFANSSAGADAGGIRIYGSSFTGSVKIFNNVVKNARNGFAVRNGENITGKAISVNNNFFDASNTSYAIYNGGTGTLDATCNYNASATPPVATKIFGSVNFQPYLTSAGDNDAAIPGFQPAPGTCTGTDVTLPVTITNVKGYSKGAGIQVEWSVQSEVNVDRYEVEKSSNGVVFNKVAAVQALTLSTTSNYNWFDANPLSGANYYRIVSVDRDGKLKYTQTVKVSIGKGAAGISVYPNPIVGNQFNIQMNNLKPGLYTLVLINKVGQQVFNKAVQVNSLSFTQSIELNHLAAGIYQVRLVGEGSNFIQQVIKSE